MLIVFEGIHQVGKSSQIELLREYFKNKGINTTVVDWNSSPIYNVFVDQKKN